ncbi:MAG: MFS transporter [Candidatus Neomarinimicrobiota bacterium]
MKRPEKIILSITGGSHLSVHALMLAFPSLIPVIRAEFSLGLDTLGYVAAVSAFMFGIGAIPSGWAENKVGGRKLLLLYQFGSAAGAGLLAFSTNFYTIVIGLAVMGLFCSIYHPAGLTLISNRVDSLTKGMAVHGIFGSIGSALGPILATTLAVLISWRAAYGFLCLFNLTLALISIFIIPVSTGSDDINKKESPQSGGTTNKQALFYLYMTNIILGLVYFGFSTFMPTHFASNTGDFLPHLSPAMKAGICPTLVFLAGIIGQIIGGKIGTKYKSANLLVILVGANIPILLLMGFTVNITLVLISILMGVVFFTNQPIGNTLIAQFTNKNRRGLGYGISFFLSFGVGSLAAGFCGVIAQNYGVSFVFPALGLILVPALFTAFKVKRLA